MNARIHRFTVSRDEAERSDVVGAHVPLPVRAGQEHQVVGAVDGGSLAGSGRQSWPAK
jgi:hypothetical protein